jgi:hypothetical protein
MDIEITGRTAELILSAAVGNPMTTAIYEGLCPGNTQAVIRGAAVCYAPTLGLLRRAASENRNLILSREHPYFLHGGLNYSYTSGGLEAALKDDPVVQAKREIIDRNQLVVLRFGGAWDQFRPKAASMALARALGWSPVSPAPEDRARGAICNIVRTNLAALAHLAAARLSAHSIRTIGDPRAAFSTVAVLAGETDPTAALGRLLADTKIDGIVAGAGGTVDEVDGAIAYFRDVISAGRKIAMLAVGYGPSHEPGVADFALWARSVFPSFPVDYWKTPDLTWIPR